MDQRTWYLFVVSLMIVSVVGCGSIDRHPDSGYGSTSMEVPLTMTDEEAYALDPYGRDIASLSNAQRSLLNDKMALLQMEKGIRDLEDRKLYYRYKDQMSSDSERLYFLQLPTYAAKETYLRKRNLWVDDANYSPRTEELIAENDISIGMPMKAVIESWGEPRLREVSGHEMLGNQRWHFTKYIKSVEGYKREDRIVTFEGGLVRGWETH